MLFIETLDLSKAGTVIRTSKEKLDNPYFKIAADIPRPSSVWYLR